MNKTNKPKIIVIGGYGRSGSTLLEKILASKESVFATGELRHIWERSFLEDQLCSCNNRFSECAFWTKSIEDFMEHKSQNITEIIQLKSRVDRMRWIPSLLFRSIRSPKWSEEYEQYTQIILGLYQSIFRTANCEIIIDSSKDPSYVYLLNAMAEDELIDLKIIHLVRDSRAVAYSWLRNKRRPEIHWQEENMPIYPPTKSAVEWVVMNFWLTLLGFFAKKRYFFVKYEDFTSYPQNELNKITNFVNINTIDLDKIENKDHHTISGNPIRFEQGQIKIKPDTEWIEKLDKKDKALISLISLPLLIQYKYL